MVLPTSPAWSLGLYLALCLFAALVGRGLVRLLRLQISEPGELVLGLVLTFLAWSLALGVCGGLRMPLMVLAPWLWRFSGLAALFGMLPPLPAWRRCVPSLALVVILPLLLMHHQFLHGICEDTGTIALDGWTYTAGGQFLWEHGRLPEDGQITSLLHRVGNCYCEERYLSFAFLAYFSPLVCAGETLPVVALYKAWALCCVGAAVFLWWISTGRQQLLAAIGTTLTVLSGWMGTVIWANNCDQLLALLYMPALAAVVNLWPAHDARRWLLLGMLVAGLGYSYPEFAAFSVLGACLIALPGLWEAPSMGRHWLTGGIFALLLACVLLLPAASTLLLFMHRQCGIALHCGGQQGFAIYEGLLDMRFAPASFWALGGECYGRPPTSGKGLLAALLTGLFLLGLFVLMRRRDWGVAATSLIFLAGAVCCLSEFSYPYAAYKLLSLSVWCALVAVVAGSAWLVRQLPGRMPGQFLACVLVCLALSIGFAGNQMNRPLWPSPCLKKPLSVFARVREIQRVVGAEPVLLAVDDWLANELAIYNLRDVPLYVISHRAWLADEHIAAFTGTVQEKPPDAIRYVLTDNRPKSKNGFVHYGRIVWEGGPYQLWELEDGDAETTLVHVENAYGLEQDRNGDFLWLGPQGITLHIRARHAGTLELSLDLTGGPNRPGTAYHRLQVVSPAGEDLLVLPSGISTLAWPVEHGMNRIILKPLDAPTRLQLPNGDPRTLLVECRRLSLKEADH